MPGEGETALLSNLSRLGFTDGSCPRSLLDFNGQGVLWERCSKVAIKVAAKLKHKFLALSVMRPSSGNVQCMHMHVSNAVVE